MGSSGWHGKIFSYTSALCMSVEYILLKCAMQFEVSGGDPLLVVAKILTHGT